MSTLIPLTTSWLVSNPGPVNRSSVRRFSTIMGSLI